MQEQPGPLDPTCPMCQKPVAPGDHVVFGHGEMIHLNCHFSGGGITQSVGTFLRRHVAMDYCQSCLARLTQLTYEQVVKAVTALRMTRHYRVTAMGTCSVCANRWMTVRAEQPAVGGARRGRILIVDNDPQSLDTLTEHLTTQGYAVLAALTTMDALKLVDAMVPDLLLLSVAMLDGDGPATLRSIHRRHADLPLVMLSRTTDVEVAGEMFKHGAFDDVAKPFDSGYLLTAIDAAIAYRRVKRSPDGRMVRA
jgi:CheY-like chemotaxis protein